MPPLPRCLDQSRHPNASRSPFRIPDLERHLLSLTLVLTAVLLPGSSFAEDDSEGDVPQSTANLAQNPIAKVISVPFQNNTYVGFGPEKGTENILLIQPVIPIQLNSDWDLITRTIVPVESIPAVSSRDGATSGIGNVEPQFYFSPAHPGSVIWGVGPQLWLPTASNPELGLNHWGGGVSAVALEIRGSWLYGVLVNNVWAGSGPNRVNELTMQPFVNYNMKAGWYLVSSPVWTARWNLESSQRWTVPLGGGVGRVFKVRGQVINLQSQLFYNVARPDYAPNWQLRLQAQFLFPEH